MTKINIEEVVDHMSSDLRSALEQAVGTVIPEIKFDRDDLFREFKRAVRRKCNQWEAVPDRCIRE